MIVRSNNIYGPEQYVDKVVPKFICRLLLGLPLQIHGDGSAMRSFLHVDDAVSAVATIWKSGVVGETYNIAADEEIEILDLANWLMRRAASLQRCHVSGVVLTLAPEMEFVRDRVFNDGRYFVNGDALKALGWSAGVSLERGLTSTFEWYAENLHKMGLVVRRFGRDARRVGGPPDVFCGGRINLIFCVPIFSTQNAEAHAQMVRS